MIFKLTSNITSCKPFITSFRNALRLCIQRTRIISLAVILFIPSVDAQSTNSNLTKLPVGAVIEHVEESINRLISTSFDRLDLSSLLIAMELRATINALRTQFQDTLTTSVSELDVQQRRLITDLQALSASMNNDLTGVVTELRDGTNEALSDIKLLVSNNPGSIFIVGRPAIVTDEYLDIEITGSALSNATMRDFRITTLSIEPTIAYADDRRVVYRIPMELLLSSGILHKDMDEPVELPVAFSFVDNSFWSFLSPGRRPFVTSVVVVPSILGEVRAVFSRQEMDEERRRQCRGPFESRRVKSKLTWKGVKVGKRYDVWSASPSNGWRIDLDTIDYDFVFVFDSCWSRRGGASWIEQTEHMLRVRAYTIAERLPTKTCKTRTTICFDEWKPKSKSATALTGYKALHANQTTVLRLNRPHSKARLAHLEVSSPMYQGGSKIFRLKDMPSAFRAEYDEAGQAVYVTMGYVR